MKFIPKIRLGLIPCGILTIAALGWTESVNYVTAATPPAAMQNTLAIKAPFQTSWSAPVIPAVKYISPASGQAATPDYYIPVTHWYKSKHWWKGNAPIIGGAAGGALIGGLAGGGTGALIGGGAGAGGGALYKHYSHRHHHYGSAGRSASPPYQPQQSHSK